MRLVLAWAAFLAAAVLLPGVHARADTCHATRSSLALHHAATVRLCDAVGR